MATVRRLRKTDMKLLIALALAAAPAVAFAPYKEPESDEPTVSPTSYPTVIRGATAPRSKRHPAGVPLRAQPARTPGE